MVELKIMAIIYHYRYLGLYVLLALGMIGLPIPDEALMVMSGFQTTLGNMSLPFTFIVAFLGSATGMTLSYFIGRWLDRHLLHKLKWKNFIKRLDNFEKWFAQYGGLILIIGYFFPGFRHIAAYFAGMSRYDLKKYMMLILTGAFLWSGTFVLLGRYMGHHWQEILQQAHDHFLFGSIIMGVFIVGFYFWTNRNKERQR